LFIAFQILRSQSKQDDVNIRFVATLLLACIIEALKFKGRVQCFSVQIVMNKYFLLNPEKNLACTL